MLIYKFIYNFSYSQEVYYNQLQPYSTLLAPKHLMQHSADFLKLELLKKKDIMNHFTRHVTLSYS